MATYIFIALTLCTTLDVVAIGLVCAFFDKKWQITNLLLRYIILTPIISVFALIGMSLGKLASGFMPEIYVHWYAASLWLILTIKLVYDGLKTARIKRTINPSITSGLLAHTVFIGINTLIYSLGAGLLNTNYKLILWYAPLFFIALLLTSIFGRQQNKLHHVYNGWIMAIVTLFCALYTVFSNQL